MQSLTAFEIAEFYSKIDRYISCLVLCPSCYVSAYNVGPVTGTVVSNTPTLSRSRLFVRSAVVSTVYKATLHCDLL